MTKTCLNLSCPERKGGECTAQTMAFSVDKEAVARLRGEGWIEQYVREAHIKWLAKAKTAVIEKSELTVLPYGYLSQAIREALQAHESHIKETQEQRVGLMRQWLNEDRIKDPERFVTNEELMHWLADPL